VLSGAFRRVQALSGVLSGTRS
jgi:hypothetical protein